jgi:hypothetical protein
MKKITKAFRFSIYLVFLLLSCTANNGKDTNITSATKTANTVTSTAVSEPTVTIYTPTGGVTSNPISSRKEIEESCIELSEKNSGIHENGILLLRHQLERNGTLNLQDLAESKVLDQDGTIRSYLLSPDMKHLSK